MRIGILAKTILMIAAVSVPVVGGTYAFFTAQTGAQSNEYTAGTVSIAVGDEYQNFFDANLNTGNLAPGDTGTGYLTIENTGSLDAWVFIQQLTMDVANDGRQSLFEGIPGNNTQKLKLIHNNGDQMIPAGESRTFEIDYLFPLSASNAYQGKTGSVDVKFHAVQVKNNPQGGFTQTNEGTGTTVFADDQVQFNTGTDGNSFVRVRQNGYHGVKLSEITGVSYDSYVEAGPAGQAPYLMLRVDYKGTNAWDDLLIFEPKYNGSVAQGVWQSWSFDFNNGLFWSKKAVGGSTTAAPKTLAQIQAAYPDAEISIVNDGDNYGGILLGAGKDWSTGNWANFTGYMDNLVISVNGEETTFNFD